ncbi:MAG: ABC-2 transporter permease [Clostridia bacterium]
MFVCVLAIGGAGEEMWKYIPIVMTTMTGMIALSTFSYDELAKSDEYVLSLPVNKKEIVVEKYILVISMALIGGIIGFIITPIFAHILNNIRADNIINIDYNSLLFTTLGGLFGISLILAIQIPSIYKWGTEKGRIQMFILFFIIILLALGIAYLVTHNLGININIEAINVFFQRFGILIVVCLLTLMYYISYRISYKIFRNKKN